MANGTLSGYFEKQKEKADRVGPSPYASSDGAAPAAPAPTAAPAPAAAPSSQKAGGTGFVNFGTYFGANAPAIQAQAQKAVEKAQGPTAPQNSPYSSKDYATQIADVSKQFEGLNPAAQTGDMGKGTSLFDQMLGGGVTQRAAQQAQQPLSALRQRLEQEQAQTASDLAADKQQRAVEEADTKARLQQQYDTRQKAQEAEQKAQDLYTLSPAAQNRPWSALSEQEKDQYRRVYATNS
jgi:hypothetical protein